MLTRELEYDLPDDLIARTPSDTRDGGRLLVVDTGQTPPFGHATVRDLERIVPDRALLVVNDTKVIPARLRGHKPTGGQVEIFLLRALDASGRRWAAFGRSGKPLRAGTPISLGDAPDASVSIVGRLDDGTFEVQFDANDPWAVIERFGEIPIPPYFRRAPTDVDRERYQTVFARRPGAVAAPTAGLHLTPRLLDALDARGIERASVTLHVGAGTFAPVMSTISTSTECIVSGSRSPTRRPIASSGPVPRADPSWQSEPLLCARSRVGGPTAKAAHRRHGIAHPARVFVSGGGRTAHELSSPTKHAARAGHGLRGRRHDSPRIC